MKITSAFLSFLVLLLIQACDNANISPTSRTKTSGNIETFAGQGPLKNGFTGDGDLATSAMLSYVTAVATDHLNNVYVTDGASNVVRKINAVDGKISTIAGTFLGYNVVDPTPYAGDGGPATQAHLNIPWSIAVDGSDNLSIVDIGNNVVRQISSATGFISTIAGKANSQSYDGDGNLATLASFNNLYNVAADAAGNIYVVDSQNNTVRMITKSTGKISTIAGLGPNRPGYTGDNGPAVAATLNAPMAIAVDANSNIYIADNLNNVIRKISVGVITTIAGTGAKGYTGDGGPATAATFFAVRGIAVDNQGNIFIADSGNNVIRKITASSGKISTIAGTGAPGYEGDGASALAAKLSSPFGIAVDSAGNVYIADSQNSAVRVVWK
ncbi:MAG: hypothetical protein JJE09_10420 [Bacteroidia bacterium]|nr:hypothetical protein [Bacteroidia bacterium]